MNSSATTRDRDESPGARDAAPSHNESMFRQMFERSADAMFLCDPGCEIFVDCNQVLRNFCSSVFPAPSGG
jgi:hypothetical protein